MLVVVEAREPGGKTLGGRLELRVEVYECLQLRGQPAERHGLVAAALLELLDAAIGEIDEDQPPKTSSSRFCCSTSCVWCDPAAGEAALARDTCCSDRPPEAKALT